MYRNYRRACYRNIHLGLVVHRMLILSIGTIEEIILGIFIFVLDVIRMRILGMGDESHCT